MIAIISPLIIRLINNTYDIAEIFCLSFNHVNGLHQQIVVKIIIDVEEKAHGHLPQRKWNDQRCYFDNKVFVFRSVIFLNRHFIVGQKVRRMKVVL